MLHALHIAYTAFSFPKISSLVNCCSMKVDTSFFIFTDIHLIHGRAWCLPGRWRDGGRGSTVARWTRRPAAPAYAPLTDKLILGTVDTVSCLSPEFFYCLALGLFSSELEREGG